MEKIKFSLNDENLLEIVRTIILDALKEGSVQQFPVSTEKFIEKIEFVGEDQLAKRKFLLLTHEILWELIIQRIITPGTDTANPNLPFLRVTDYGKKVLNSNEFVPYDPANYLQRYTQIFSILDPVAFEYVKESLVSFNSGCYLAAVMMLGIASEKIFLDFCDVLLNALTSPREKQKFVKILKGISMVAKFNFVQGKVDQVMNVQGGALPSDTRMALLGIFDFIRMQRNDIGHPQDNLQNPDREKVFVNLRIFPEYCKTVEVVKGYLINNPV